MKDSIGGKARTLMIVNMSPSVYDLQETMDSLKFARSTGQIRNIVESAINIKILYEKFYKFLKYEMFSYIELDESREYHLLHHKHSVRKRYDVHSGVSCNLRHSSTF
jgi:hypothetical protein